MSRIIKALEDFIAESDMPNEKLKIMIVGMEASPYASVGGFASVLGYLSQELESLGHDVRLFIPKFGHLDEDKYDLEMVHKGLRVPTGDPEHPYLVCNVKQACKPAGVPVYFLENHEYYEKRANVYGYSDDPTRMALLSRGVLEFIKTKKFVPNVVHCNDWHTGLVPNYLNTTYSDVPVLADIATVFTIHNLKFQGLFDHMHVSELDMDDGRSEVASLFSDRLNSQNFMRRGILHADAVNTVSKKYAKEVLTPEFGEGLDNLLQEVREKFFGIINGLDYSAFNPKTDKLLEKNYDVTTLKNRVENKKALQEEFDLPVRPDVPVLGFVGRLDHQKGIDLLVNVLHAALKDYDIQFVQVGGGDPYLKNLLEELKGKFPEKVGVHTFPNFSLPRLVFGGADIMIYPSRFEPSGIVQLEAMRYGAVPVVRKVGGFSDTVQNFDSVTHKGTGFVFNDFNEFSLYGQIVRALELMKQKKIWEKIQKNGMEKDFSWGFSAREYLRLYELALSFKNSK